MSHLDIVRSMGAARNVSRIYGVLERWFACRACALDFDLNVWATLPPSLSSPTLVIVLVIGSDDLRARDDAELSRGRFIAFHSANRPRGACVALDLLLR